MPNPYPVTNPELIPAERYYDDTFFKLEAEHVWPHVWQMACRVEELAEIGDYTTYTCLKQSAIITRTADGIRAYRNACRHRGVQLANGPGNCSANGFVCPFHGWRWNGEGTSTFVYGRQIFSDDVLAKAEIDLVPVRVEEWAGCAFINFDDAAPPLRDCLGPVADRMDARHAEHLKMDWWYATELPTNWKTAMEAFMEGYHVMQTHPQLHKIGVNADGLYGPQADGTMLNTGLDGDKGWDLSLDHMVKLSEGMDGLVHSSEVAVMEQLRGAGFAGTGEAAKGAFFARASAEITSQAQAAGAKMPDLLNVLKSVKLNPVEYMFPHYFLLPMFGSMSAYRIRPLTPETCWFELWSLTMRPEGQSYDTPSEPTFMPYDSPDYPEIPRQDYSNLPLQQLGLHNISHMRLSHEKEGMISNYQRLIDGFIAGLGREKLRHAENVVNSGFDAPVLDIGF